MKKMSKECKIRNVFGNFIITCLIAIIFLSCILINVNGKSTMASNSEYNGTIYAGDKKSKNVSIMVNIYWGEEYLEKIIEVFEKYNIKTTFFIGGSWAIENNNLLKKLKDMGHEIASHGYSHKEHGKLDYSCNLIEIQKCHNVVKEIVGIDMELFAPPGGSYNSKTIKAAADLGYKTIMWTRDTIDWRDQNCDLIYKRALTGICGGDLILTHPTRCTADILEKIILGINSKGLNITTVSETLGL